MTAADADHDPAFGKQIGSSDLAGKHSRVVNRRADDPCKKTDALRALRRSNVQPQGKRRAGEQIFAVTLGRRKKVIAQFVGKRDLLQDFGVGLAFRLFRIRKLSK